MLCAASSFAPKPWRRSPPSTSRAASTIVIGSGRCSFSSSGCESSAIGRRCIKIRGIELKSARRCEAASRRFFVDHEIAGESLELAGPEAHHLIHVVRAQAGDEVVVFDGRGGEYPAEIVSVGRSSATLRLGGLV